MEAQCVYPECTNSPRTRGLCHPHYQAMRSYVRAAKADVADLLKRGLMLNASAPGAGSPIAGSAAFLIGSKIRGDARRGKSPRAS